MIGTKYICKKAKFMVISEVKRETLVLSISKSPCRVEFILFISFVLGLSFVFSILLSLYILRPVWQQIGKRIKVLYKYYKSLTFTSSPRESLFLQPPFGQLFSMIWPNKMRKNKTVELTGLRRVKSYGNNNKYARGFLFTIFIGLQRKLQRHNLRIQYTFYSLAQSLSHTFSGQVIILSMRILKRWQTETIPNRKNAINFQYLTTNRHNTVISYCRPSYNKEKRTFASFTHYFNFPSLILRLLI